MTDRAWTDRTRQRTRTKFLDALAKAATVTEACAAAKISRSGVYSWRENDAEFAAAWDAALEMGADVLEAEAIRRAVHGVQEPLIGRVGKDEDGVITYVTKRSDALLTLLLKGKRPSVYRERTSIDVAGTLKHEHTGDEAFAAVARALGGHAAGSASGAVDDGGVEGGGEA